jgi:hypothetical protein
MNETRNCQNVGQCVEVARVSSDIYPLKYIYFQNKNHPGHFQFYRFDPRDKLVTVR